MAIMIESLGICNIRILELAETLNSVELKIIKYLSKTFDAGGSRSQSTFLWHTHTHGIGSALDPLIKSSQQPSEENDIIIPTLYMGTLRQRCPS